MQVFVNLRIVVSVLTEAAFLPLKQQHYIRDTKTLNTSQQSLLVSLTLGNETCIRTKFEIIFVIHFERTFDPTEQRGSFQKKTRSSKWSEVKQPCSGHTCEQDDGLAVPEASIWPNKRISVQTAGFLWRRPCFPERVTGRRAVETSRTSGILHACRFLRASQTPKDPSFSHKKQRTQTNNSKQKILP